MPVYRDQRDTVKRKTTLPDKFGAARNAGKGSNCGLAIRKDRDADKRSTVIEDP